MTDIEAAPELESDYYSEDVATFGDRVMAARNQMGITQSKLSSLLGVKPTTIDKWENDVVEPRANKLQTLSGVLGVSLRWLISGEVDESYVEEDVRDMNIEQILSDLRIIRTENKRLNDKLALVEKNLRKISPIVNDV